MISFDLLIFDYIIVILTIIIAIFSLWKGFINSVLGLLTWIGSLFITIYSYDYLSDYINNLLLNFSFLSSFTQFSYVLSILISIPFIFLLSLFIFKRIRKALSSDLDKKILGIIFDKLFGAIYGLIFSYIIFSTILYFTENNDLKILNNINYFLTDNSNILKEVSKYNYNIIQTYLNNNY